MENADIEPIARSAVARLDRMVRGDGGQVTLIGVEGAVIRVGYRPGADPDCVVGTCVLPEIELRAMLIELIAARAPGVEVRVERR